MRQSSGDGNNFFEIRQYQGDQHEHRSHLFVPHRKDYYFFFLVTGGHNTHWIDFIKFDITPGNIYFTLPHQIHFKEQHAPVSGTMLTFSREFLFSEQQGSLMELPVICNPDDRHGLTVTAQDQTYLEELFARMQEEYLRKEDWSTGMLHAYLKIFLLHISRMYTRQYGTSHPQAENQSLLRRMKDLLNQQYHKLHQVSDYAQKLNVTPGHLNDTIREKTGMNATTLIQQRIALEAKRSLFHSGMSVKEIGYSLGFEDPAYFNRFFKRITGETPAGFRERLRSPNPQEPDPQQHLPQQPAPQQPNPQKVPLNPW